MGPSVTILNNQILGIQDKAGWSQWLGTSLGPSQQQCFPTSVDIPFPGHRWHPCSSRHERITQVIWMRMCRNKFKHEQGSRPSRSMMDPKWRVIEGKEWLLWEWTIANLGPTLGDPMDHSRQAPLSIGSPRQEYWTGLSFPPPRHLPDPGNRTHLFYISCTGKQILYHWVTWKPWDSGQRRGSKFRWIQHSREALGAEK